MNPCKEKAMMIQTDLKNRVLRHLTRSFDEFVSHFYNLMSILTLSKNKHCNVNWTRVSSLHLVFVMS